MMSTRLTALRRRAFLGMPGDVSPAQDGFIPQQHPCAVQGHIAQAKDGHFLALRSSPDPKHATCCNFRKCGVVKEVTDDPGRRTFERSTGSFA